ncbi:mannonate dehydratase [Rhizobium sp. BK313]|uniref:mannonate dehydratase n=1 Tax=Rhizobium sp. BK313 TaxID=2587081 RepID=UPI00105D17B2|nr:mannonate dehydratase [Rhizobium sp. BK313]MBB3454352.1 mannonate dehydratase [Rhizobium sp. BK313]
MEQTWRWFGPDDPVKLHEIRQAGATGIVSALHHIRYGEVWSIEEIEARQRIIGADPSLGLRWSVVESLPVAEAIKLGEGDLTQLFDNYRQSLRNLASCGITNICYNFMAMLDWTRTELRRVLPGGATALRYNAEEVAAFDCYILQRPDAEADHRPDVLERARAWMKKASESDKHNLLATIMAGLPGAYERYDVPGMRTMLKRFDGITRDDLRANYKRFLEEVVPTAEELGIRLGVHPDDPPFDVFGLPRIVSTAADIDFIVGAVPSKANGITFCTGAFGAGPANDVPAMAERFAPHIQFAHLRNVLKEPDGSFMEADHLGGDVDVVKVIRTLLAEQARRKGAGEDDWRIPFRPDHGHELLNDGERGTHPGYPMVGRLKGLAELRGVMMAVSAIDHQSR